MVDLVSDFFTYKVYFMINDKVYNISPEIAGRVTLKNVYFEIQ